jgi:hypothetical protein
LRPRIRVSNGSEIRTDRRNVQLCMTFKQLPIPVERIERAILLVRGQRVMLDRDLATLYGVETGALNQAVKRNRDRFPDDFMFELTRDEIRNISQSVICSSTMKHEKNAYAFTEQGVAMLSSVLHSKRAVQVNIEIMRVFVRLREMMATHKELAFKLVELEERLEGHDEQIQNIFEAIRQLMTPPDPPQSLFPLPWRERREPAPDVIRGEGVVFH